MTPEWCDAVIEKIGKRFKKAAIRKIAEGPEWLAKLTEGLSPEARRSAAWGLYGAAGGAGAGLLANLGFAKKKKPLKSILTGAILGGLGGAGSGLVSKTLLDSSGQQRAEEQAQSGDPRHIGSQPGEGRPNAAVSAFHRLLNGAGTGAVTLGTVGGFDLLHNARNRLFADTDVTRLQRGINVLLNEPGESALLNRVTSNIASGLPQTQAAPFVAPAPPYPLNRMSAAERINWQEHLRAAREAHHAQQAAQQAARSTQTARDVLERLRNIQPHELRATQAQAARTNGNAFTRAIMRLFGRPLDAAIDVGGRPVTLSSATMEALRNADRGVPGMALNEAETGVHAFMSRPLGFGRGTPRFLPASRYAGYIGFPLLAAYLAGAPNRAGSGVTVDQYNDAMGIPSTAGATAAASGGAVRPPRAALRAPGTTP